MKRQALDKGLEFHVESSLSSDTLITDPIHLKQVLENLVGNAVKFTDKGSVSVRLYEENESRWGIEVIDTGPGIEKDRMPVLFESFSLAGNDYATRTFQGIGLGLTVAKQLIELMNGRISVDSQVDSGTKVHCRIPVRTESVQPCTIIMSPCFFIKGGYYHEWKTSRYHYRRRFRYVQYV